MSMYVPNPMESTNGAKPQSGKRASLNVEAPTEALPVDDAAVALELFVEEVREELVCLHLTQRLCGNSQAAWPDPESCHRRVL